MPDAPHTNPGTAIPARTRRIAMDWSLVLASQGIAALIQQGGNGWELVVDPAEVPRALAALRQYQIENRGWPWRQEWSGAGSVFDWGAVFWVIWMAAFYYWSTVRLPSMKEVGIVNGEAIRHGEWWRLFTAVTLHENLPHLISNAATGFLLLGLAMGRFGPGIALLAAFLAGAAGNLAATFLSTSTHYSLGASGMVTAALGLLTLQTASLWPQSGGPRKLILRGAAAGLLMLVMIGFDPASDLVAHVGGFVAGAGLGFALSRFQPANLQRFAPNLVSILALIGLVLWTWALARPH